MKIRQLLAEKKTTEVECVRPDATLRETAEQLLQHRIGALVVTDEAGHLKGIASERDLIHVVASFDATASEKPVSEVMTSSVITCEPDDEISHILHLMNSNAIRHMPVLNKGKLVNMVSIAYSGVIRPPVPIASGHPYRFDPAGDSGASGHPHLGRI